MDQHATPPPLPPQFPAHPAPPPLRLPQPLTTAQRARKVLTPIALGLAVAFKYGAKIKFIGPLLKLLPVMLKTGGTMILSIGVYAMSWGLWFAVGFVLLMLVHECGHLIAAKRVGLKVGAPVFIPFMGAMIALQEAPRDAWIEAQVGIGGPLLGTLGAVFCDVLFLITGNPMFRALAYTGFFLNLFNLAPIGFLDGGRIVTALSPWLWLVGALMAGAMLFVQFNVIVLMVLVLAVPRLVSLFRKRTDEEKRYFEVSPPRRLVMAGLYFGLIAFLLVAMQASYLDPGSTLTAPPTSSLAR
jgi:Zn-dependent protease